MKFLFIQTKYFFSDIAWALSELNHDVSILEETDFDPNSYDTSQQNFVKSRLQQQHFDYVISYLFTPSVSDICFEYSIPYISWTYDSPLEALFTPSIFHPTNYIFIFDREEYKRLLNLHVPHVYHLPLATNISRTGKLIIEEEEEHLYSHDISFVGGLYSKNTYNDFINSFPEIYQLELKSYLMKHLCHWESKRSWPVLSAECTNFINDAIHSTEWHSDYLLDNATYLGLLLLSRKLGEMERTVVLNTLAQNFQVDLYTRDVSDFLKNKNIHVHENVDYITVMNKIFHLSKINLNMTLPSIETGIPLRVLDIMGCGGFVLTNYQEELEDHFIIGTDIEVFHNLDELTQKTDFYLNHEKERMRIAANGYQKIKHAFSYPAQLTKILSIVQEDSK